MPRQWAAVDNYTRALTQVPLLRYLWNGIVVCGGILILQIIVSLPAAYCFAKLKFRGKRLAWGLVLLSLMIPFQATAIPLYILLYHAGLLDTTAALILPFIASAFGIFLMRQFFIGVPDDLIHAARLDGMGEFELVWRVMMPAAMPALIAFSIFSVVWHWNDYFWPLLQERGSRHGFRPPNGRHGDHHPALALVLSVGAEALHRGRYPHRCQRLKEPPCNSNCCSACWPASP